MKIIKVHTAHLRGEEHQQLMSSIDELFAQSFVQRSSPMENIDANYTEFKEWLRKESIAVEKIRKNDLTVPIADADAVRDSVHLGLITYVKAYSYHADAEMVEAARKLNIVLDHYSNVREKSYNEELSAIRNIIEDIRGTYSSESELIGANAWVDLLEEKNDYFDELMNKRYDTNASKEEVDLREARENVDAAYGRLRDIVEAMNLLSGGVTFEDLIKRMNERLSYYKTTLAQRKGRSAAKKEDEEMDS